MVALGLGFRVSEQFRVLGLRLEGVVAQACTQHLLIFEAEGICLEPQIQSYPKPQTLNPTY